MYNYIIIQYNIKKYNNIRVKKCNDITLSNIAISKNYIL